MQERRGNGRVGRDERQRGGHIGMNHAGAFGAADEMDPLAGHFEGSSGGFRARVGGAYGERSFGKGARRRAAEPRNDGQRSQNFFERQRNANDAGGADEDFLRRAVKTLGRFGDRALGGCVTLRASGAIRIAGIYHHGAHAALRGAQVLLGNQDGSSDNEILRKNGGGGGGHVTREDGEVEGASFFQAASGRGEAEAAREGCL
ncbi:MAG TPA: hypothetical protein VH114_05005 [Candidatus Acidoferrum sp.]|nr:hypothetical protein [Candidatus Acidoferrum sp.]